MELRDSWNKIAYSFILWFENNILIGIINMKLCNSNTVRDYNSLFT